MFKYNSVEEWLAATSQSPKKEPEPCPDAKSDLEQLLKTAKDLRSVPVITIITMVANSHGITAQEIIQYDNRLKIKAIRKEAMRVACFIRSDLSLSTIARVFQRHHSIISQVCKEEA